MHELFCLIILYRMLQPVMTNVTCVRIICRIGYFRTRNNKTQNSELMVIHRKDCLIAVSWDISKDDTTRLSSIMKFHAALVNRHHLQRWLDGIHHPYFYLANDQPRPKLSVSVNNRHIYSAIDGCGKCDNVLIASLWHLQFDSVSTQEEKCLYTSSCGDAMPAIIIILLFSWDICVT